MPSGQWRRFGSGSGAAIEPAVNPVSAAVQPPFGALATTIEAAVDALAGAFQAPGMRVVSGSLGARGRGIVTVCDAVAAPVQPRFDLVPATVEMTIDAVAGGIEVGGRGGGGEQGAGQGSGDQN